MFTRFILLRLLSYEDEEEDEEDEESVKNIFTCISYLMYVTFSPNCLHAGTFLHVLHLDVLIEIETENENLMYGYNAGPPMAIPIYTVLPYCVIIISKNRLFRRNA